MSGKFYETPQSVEEYIKMAEGFDGNRLIAKMRNYIFPQSSILELGSGPGTDWEILNKNFKVIGSDFSTEFISRLKKQFPKGEFLELDASSLTTNNKFDAIYSNKVLHHLEDGQLTSSVKRQAELLNPQGVICHSFWKGEGSETFKGLFVNYHDKEGLNNIFGDHFRLLLVQEYKEFDENDSLLMIAQKS